MTGLDRTSTVLVTGATGFLGRQVVAAALGAGVRVRAVVRPGTDLSALSWGGHPALQTARIDLRRPRDLAQAVHGCDTVVHLAAAKTGDFMTRFTGTVVATENLLGAMDEAGVHRLVHCSSFSVYRSAGVARGDVLDEDAPLEDRPLLRDEYAQVKLLQEQLVRDWAASDGGRQLTVLRPGLIYGPEEPWHALLGVELLPGVWMGAGRKTPLPLAWVENVADAFVCAAALSPLVDGTINIVDSRSPSIAEYVRAVRPLVDSPPRVLPLGYFVSKALVGAVAVADRRLLGGRLKLPSGLSPSTFEARFRPLRYTNQRAQDLLGWTPRQEFPDTISRVTPRPSEVSSVAAQDPHRSGPEPS